MIREKDDFCQKMFRLSIPIIIQGLLSAAVNSADVIMLNYVGQSSISAVSLAANYSNILFMVYNGLGTGAALLCTQYFGRNNIEAIHIIEGIALRFSIIISALTSVIAFTMPGRMMMLFTTDQDLISIGASYLQIMGITYLCWSITEMYIAVLRSVGRVTVCMVLNILAFTLNVLLNAVFIFGLFGVPQMGATGVAIATAVSRSAELAACVVVSVFSRDVKLSLAYMFAKNQALYTDFIKMSLPALGNDVSWSVAFSMYSVILGHLGTDAVAANSIVSVVRNIGTVFCFSVASAGSILLGSMMGKGDLEKSKLHASKTLKATVIAGAVGGMIVLAVTLGFIAAFILKLPVMWVYFLLCTDEFAKWPWVIHHYRSGKWAQNITREDVFAEKAVFLSHTDIK